MCFDATRNGPFGTAPVIRMSMRAKTFRPHSAVRAQKAEKHTASQRGPSSSGSASTPMTSVMAANQMVKRAERRKSIS